MTNPRIFEQPKSTKDAWKQIEEWLCIFNELAGSRILEPEIDSSVNGKRLENTILLFDKKMSKSKKKYYAVRVGRNPGNYSKWVEKQEWRFK